MGCADEVAAATTVEGKLDVIARELDRMHLKLVYKNLMPGSIGSPRRMQPATGVKALRERHLESTDVRRIFEVWVATMSKRSYTKLTPERRRAIQARLKQGYTVEFVCDAIRGCASSDFHMARGQYAGGKRFDDLTLICRSGSKLEEFHAMRGADEEETRRAFL